jgi:hypothetical protein
VFRDDILKSIHQIFGFKKTTFDAPSDSFEQDTCFVNIERSNTRASSKVIYAKARGHLTVYSQANKLTFGYFNKRIEKADPELTKKFFFFDIDIDIENSPSRVQNIHERRVSFDYFFSGQYDPNKGSLTTIDWSLDYE